MRVFLTGFILCLILSFLQFLPGQASAGAIPVTQLHTPNGSSSTTSQGDYISPSGGLDTYYSYFIEVPPGLSELHVDIWDADIGAGGGSETADRRRGGWNTSVSYTLIDPNGAVTAAATLPAGTCGGCNNNWATWTSMPVINPLAGHWEVRVDMSSAVTIGNDINGFAMRAHDGSPGTGGTELNVYAHSFAEIGPHSGSNTYQLYPFITSGCTADSNDFDWDNNGSISFTSRTGAFSQNNPGVSGNRAWLNTPFSGWTTDTWSADYGIWNASINLSSGANYGTFYMGDFNAAGPPPASQPEADSFRLYLPDDAGTAPVKPILTQTLSLVSGPNPPAAGSTTRVRVQITVFNPTPYPITFSAGNLVTANVPGAGAVYAGNASVSQGSITGQPAIGGTGDITWNPGTLAAGTNATMTYDIDATPAVAGERVSATGIPALNGTRARYVDETGNTVQTRAAYTYGPLCELAVTEGGTPLPTIAVISGFRTYEDAGRVVVQWETASEIGTIGFYLYREISKTGEYLQVNEDLLVGLLHSPQGGTYRYVDEEAWPGETYTYKLVEVEASGNYRGYGPFTATVNEQGIDAFGGRAQQSALKPMDSTYSKKPRKVSATKEARIQASKASQKVVNASRMKKAGSEAKIAIREDGLYYLDASKIATVLVIPSWLGNQRIRKKNGFSLSNQGQKIAYTPAENNSGIYFYGQGIDSIYTRENIYWLKKGKGLEMKIVKGEGPDPASDGETFTETIHLEEDNWALTALFDNPQADYWLWDYIVSDDLEIGSKTFDLWADGVANTLNAATLTVYLQGATNTDASPDHHVVITLNGTEIGESYWEGTTSHKVTFSFNQGLLNEGNNTLQVTGVLDTEAAYSIFYIDSFNLTYQRLYQALEDTLLCRGGANPVVTISGFTDSEILLFEVTNPRRPKLIKATTIDEMDGEYRISFSPTSSDGLYLALTANKARAPVSFIADVPSQLKQRNNTAAYLVITPAELKDAAQSLAAYRQGQGLKAMVVELEDIMDEFNYGIFSPEAIKDFLSHVYHNWKKTPRYVVLSGEGTYDYKDNQGYGDNMVPAIMVGTPNGLFPSDNFYSDLDGDYVPEMAIGRLPASTSGELQDLITKIIDYENSTGGGWEKRVLMLADNPDDGGDFPVDSNDLAALIPPPYTAEKIYLSEHPLSEARGLVLDGINTGAVLLNYIGHAGLDRMAEEGLLLTSDLGSMSNQERLPVVTAMTCVMGQFSIPGYDSLSEALVLKQNGGAIAVWSPAGMSINLDAVILDRAFFQYAFDGTGKVLGDMILRALEEYSRSGREAYLLDIYNLTGDPALRMRGY